MKTFYLLILSTLMWSFAPYAEEMIFDYAEDEANDIMDARTFDHPERNISIIVTEEGYYPDKFSVFEGEKVNFFITSTWKIPGCFMLQQKKVFLAANMGKITEAQVMFNEPGEYNFHCPTGKMKGRITVLKRNTEESKHSRKIASVTEDKEAPTYWMPREE